MAMTLRLRRVCTKFSIDGCSREPECQHKRSNSEPLSLGSEFGNMGSNLRAALKKGPHGSGRDKTSDTEHGLSHGSSHPSVNANKLVWEANKRLNSVQDLSPTLFPAATGPNCRTARGCTRVRSRRRRTRRRARTSPPPPAAAATPW